MELLCVTLRAREGMSDTYLREIRERGLHDKTLLEPGCLKYDFFRSAEDQDLLLLVENWASDEAFQGHLQGENLKTFRELERVYAADKFVARYTV